MPQICQRPKGLWFRGQDFGFEFWVLGFVVAGLGFSFMYFWFRGQGPEFRVQGSGFRV
jgi:hypothetical protein